jgi:hypothetical protein
MTTLKAYITDLLYNYNKDTNFNKEDADKDYITILKQSRKTYLENFNKDIRFHHDENGIPKIIHLTCKDKYNIPAKYNDCLIKIRKLYHDYQIIIYDDQDIFKIVEYFDNKNIEKIKMIKIGAVLADIFRYLIIYLRGGYYFDMDCEPIQHIKHLSKRRFHGNKQNCFKITNKVRNKTYEFHEQICDNCILLNKTRGVKSYRCNGHQIINSDTKIILGKEFDKIWHKADFLNKNWIYNGIGITQWFFAAVPYQSLFLVCYLKSLKRAVKYLINIKKTSDTFHFKVINSTGPLFFTRQIDEFNKKDNHFYKKIAVFEPDYFCFGSGTTVPETKNIFIKHHFYGSWLK